MKQLFVAALIVLAQSVCVSADHPEALGPVTIAYCPNWDLIAMPAWRPGVGADNIISFAPCSSIEWSGDA